jgi:hypothetical protein
VWLNPGRYVAGRGSGVAGAPQPHLEYASFHGAGSPLTHLPMEGMPGMAYGGGSSNSAARQAAIVLGSIGAMFSALNTGLMAASTPNDPMEQIADIFGYCNMAATAGFQIANLNDEARWELLGTSGCVGLAALSVGLYYKYVKRNTQVMSDAIARGRNTLSDNMSWCLMYAASINFYLTIAELATKSYDEAVSGTITFLELLFSIYIRERRKTKPFGPYVAAGFGALMGAMNGGKVALYALRPISG